MTTSWPLLVRVFEDLGAVYFRQGSLGSEEEYPPAFYTYWQLSADYESHYDDTHHRTVDEWQIYYYDPDPETVYTGMDEFLSLAREAGFIPESAPTDLASDRPDYYGRTVRVAYSNKED